MSTTLAEPAAEAIATGPVITDTSDAAMAHLEALLSRFPIEEPTGAVPWPMVLIEGEEGAGKSWVCAEFTGSPNVGRSFWFEFGMEGTAHQYGAIPGAKYSIVPFTGYAELMQRLTWVREIGIAAKAAGEKPIVVIIDTMTAEWQALSAWANWRARNSTSALATLRKDPNADIVVGFAYWNPATDRHYALLNLLASIPGIVLLTARGSEVSEFNESGQPVKGGRSWSIQGQKGLGFDVTAHARMRRGKKTSRSHTKPTAEIMKVRSVFAGLREGDDPVEAPTEKMLDWLIFDVMKCDPEKAFCRTISQDGGDDDRAEERRRQEARQGERTGAAAKPAAAEPAPAAAEPAPAAAEPAPAAAGAAATPAPATATAKPVETPAQVRMFIRKGFEYLGVAEGNQATIAMALLVKPVMSLADLDDDDAVVLLNSLRDFSKLPDKGWNEPIADILESAAQDEARAADEEAHGYTEDPR